MKQLIEDIAKALVDIPEEVTINEIAGDNYYKLIISREKLRLRISSRGAFLWKIAQIHRRWRPRQAIEIYKLSARVQHLKIHAQMHAGRNIDGREGPRDRRIRR